MQNQTQAEWWGEGRFFGEYYILGDDSLEGYIPNLKESLGQRTEREVAGVINLLGATKIDSILDCPCGYGRHSILLANKGFNVLGVDLNRFYLKKAIKTAKKLGINAKFKSLDMRNIIKIGRKFDILINLFYSFGFFSEEENIQVMQQFYNVLKKGGRLLLHTDVCPEMISSLTYRLEERRNLRSGGKLIIDERYDPETKRMIGVWTILSVQGKKINLTPYSVRIYSKDEFEEMARMCGFKRVFFYGSFKGEEFSSKSKEMIMVAEK